MAGGERGGAARWTLECERGAGTNDRSENADAPLAKNAAAAGCFPSILP